MKRCTWQWLRPDGDPFPTEKPKPGNSEKGTAARVLLSNSFSWSPAARKTRAQTDQQKDAGETKWPSEAADAATACSPMMACCPHPSGWGKYRKMVCFTFLKTMMFVFNGVIFLGGASMLGIGIWMKVDSNSFAKVLGAAAPQLTQLINVGYLCIGVGCFLLLMGFLGCWGAVKECKCLLLLLMEEIGCVLLAIQVHCAPQVPGNCREQVTFQHQCSPEFFVLILILFIVEVSGAVVVLVFSAVGDIFVDYLKNWALKTLKENYGKQDDITTIWNTTMRELNCCGFHNYTDFRNSYYLNQTNQNYPATCCTAKEECQESDAIKSDKKGCLREFKIFLNNNGKIVGGVALGIGILELAAMAVSLILFSHIGTTTTTTCA